MMKLSGYLHCLIAWKRYVFTTSPTSPGTIMLLSDKTIKELCVNRGNKAMLTPYSPESISKLETGHSTTSWGQSSFGYDLRLGNDFKILKRPEQLPGARFIDPVAFDQDLLEDVHIDDGFVFVVPPHACVLAVTKERIIMPPDVSGVCMQKSTLARSFLEVTVTPLEAGWEGYLTLEMHNKTPYGIHLRPGMGIVQLLFYKGDQMCEVPYSARNGKYNNQPPYPVSARSMADGPVRDASELGILADRTRAHTVNAAKDALEGVLAHLHDHIRVCDAHSRLAGGHYVQPYAIPEAAATPSRDSMPDAPSEKEHELKLKYDAVARHFSWDRVDKVEQTPLKINDSVTTQQAPEQQCSFLGEKTPKAEDETMPQPSHETVTIDIEAEYKKLQESGRLQEAEDALAKTIGKAFLDLLFPKTVVSPDEYGADWMNSVTPPGMPVTIQAYKEAEVLLNEPGDQPTNNSDDAIHGKGFITTKQAFDHLKTVMAADEEYAWSWYCNLAMPIYDSLPDSLTNEERHHIGNYAAIGLMGHLFGVAIEKTKIGKNQNLPTAKVNLNMDRIFVKTHVNEPAKEPVSSETESQELPPAMQSIMRDPFTVADLFNGVLTFHPVSSGSGTSGTTTELEVLLSGHYNLLFSNATTGRYGILRKEELPPDVFRVLNVSSLVDYAIKFLPGASINAQHLETFEKLLKCLRDAGYSYLVTDNDNFKINILESLKNIQTANREAAVSLKLQLRTHEAQHHIATSGPN